MFPEGISKSFPERKLNLKIMLNTNYSKYIDLRRKAAISSPKEQVEKGDVVCVCLQSMWPKNQS